MAVKSNPFATFTHFKRRTAFKTCLRSSTNGLREREKNVIRKNQIRFLNKTLITLSRIIKKRETWSFYKIEKQLQHLQNTYKKLAFHIKSSLFI